MIRRKQSNRIRRDRTQKTDSSSSLSSLQQCWNAATATPKSALECWINPQGKTVHWNSRNHRYTRRRRRCESSVDGDTLKTSSSLHSHSMHSQRNTASLHSNSLHSQKNATFLDDVKHNLIYAKRRIRRHSSKRRNPSSMSIR